MDSDTCVGKPGGTATPAEDVTRLRSLILGDDYERAIRELQTADATEQVAGVLAEAIHLRSLRDKSVQNALAPAIDDVLDTSIRSDPNKLVQVITPIIGPSIRSAVRSALTEMVESLNRLLERSVSPQAVVWRVQAWRAGIPFGQFVLLKTLQYRVEQVLLIQRDSGILLHAESHAGDVTRDPELVSAMLTAINGFVSDSFRSGDDNAQLNRIRFGDRLLLVEAGPRAIVAALVLGDPPPELSRQLQDTLDQFQRIFGRTLDRFNGDRTVFAQAGALLQPCITEQHRTDYRRRPWLAWTVLSVLVMALGYWGWHYWQIGRQQNALVQQLVADGGYVVLNSHREGNRLELKILTPFGAAPLQPVVHKGDVELSIQSTSVAMNPEDLLLPYLERRYALGTQVSARWRDGRLVLAGTMTAQQLAGIQNDSWVRRLTPQLDTRGVSLLPPPDRQAADLQAFSQLVDQLQRARFLFAENASDISADEAAHLGATLTQLRTLIALAQSLKIQPLQVIVTGYADDTGPGDLNARLSRQRARRIMDFFADNGIDRGMLAGVGAGSLLATDLPPQQRRFAGLQVIHGTPSPRESSANE